MIEFESLNSIEPKPPDESEELAQPLNTSQQSDAEESILAHIRAHGFSSREEVAQKCRESGIEIGPRQVSRYLKILTEKGLLRREGKRYVPAEQSGDQEHQETL